MQSTHQVISQYSGNGKLCCKARDLSPGKLWVTIHDDKLAIKLQTEGCEPLSPPINGPRRDEFLQTFCVKGKSLNWLKNWLDQNDEYCPALDKDDCGKVAVMS